MWYHICDVYRCKLLGKKCNPNQNSPIMGDSLEIIWKKKTQHFLHNGVLEHRKIERDRKDYSEREDLGNANFNAVIKCWPTCGTGRWNLHLTFHSKEQCENERAHWKTCHWKATCYSPETCKGCIPPRNPRICRVFLFQVSLISLTVSKSGLCPPFHVDRLWALSPRQQGCQGVNWEAAQSHNGKHHTFCTVIPPALRSVQELLLSRNKKATSAQSRADKVCWVSAHFHWVLLWKGLKILTAVPVYNILSAKFQVNATKRRGNSRKSVTRNTVLDLMSYYGKCV